MNYFPTFLAMVPAFCNRKDELHRVKENIRANNPVLLMAARRYGKTSLVLNAVEQLNYPYVHLDIYKELSETDIEKAILNGIGRLLSQLEKSPKKLLTLASDYFSSLSIKVAYEKAGLSLVFDKKTIDPAHAILSALERLHDLAEKLNKKVILFIDEFQVIGEISRSHAIEAAIREAAQKSKHVAYVFSGSNRHLLEQMFCDKKRPFYKFCDIIQLGRIAQEHYVPYIQAAALEKWKKELPSETLALIFELSERHPYYLNKLCALLWMGEYPNEESVNEVWRSFVLESKSFVERELSFLTINQRKLMIGIAQTGFVSEPNSKEFSTDLDLSVSSISTSLSALVEKDYVYKNPQAQYALVDPLIRHVLCLRDLV